VPWVCSLGPHDQTRTKLQAIGHAPQRGRKRELNVAVKPLATVSVLRVQAKVLAIGPLRNGLKAHVQRNFDFCGTVRSSLGESMKDAFKSTEFKTSILLLILVTVIVSFSLRSTAAQTSAADIVLYATHATTIVGNWQVVSDPTAAGGARILNPDVGAPKVTTPLATPASYFELTFSAQAGTAYRLWVRGKATNDSPYNDSVYVQFSASVDAGGAAAYRIGTADGTTVNIEDGLSAGLSGWGWQDNGWGTGVMGPLIYFAATGQQTLRVQPREDGLSIDQIVLSSSTYISSSPGSLKNDSVILPESGTPPPPPPPSPSATDIVVWASDVPSTSVFGSWSRVFDSSAAGQTALHNPDLGAAKVTTPLASPANYFDVTFNAQAGRAYRLWMRGRADNDSPYNDSVYVQFSGSVDATGVALYRIGTTSATTVNLEDNMGIGVSGWGWQDNGWGTGVMGPPIYFQATGQQTMRVQIREDGLSIDQIVLSSQAYLNASPGALRNDTVILSSTTGTPPSGNQPPQVSISANPTSGTYPLTVSFSSTATDPDGYIASDSWTFGDGQTSSFASPTIVYQSAGTFTARLTVTDNSGATASASIVITVSAPSPTGVQLKILHWNVDFGEGTDLVVDYNRIVTWVSNMNPDIVSMCEIEHYSGGGDPVQTVLTLLRQRTGLTWSWHFVPKFDGCAEGNLILSKYPIVSTASHYLPYQRSVGQIAVNVNGKIVNYFATHLDYQYSSYRQAEVTDLMGWLTNFAEPRIIGGDFNAGPDLPEIGQMVSTYFDSWYEGMGMAIDVAYPDNPVQWMTRTRRGRLDYIFYSRGAGTLTLAAAQIPDQRDLSRPAIETIGTLDDLGVRPSDHNFVTATFIVK
jgi:endonuclease/exonuclease/phosphatase family metal-dependent hydrolase